MTDKVQKIREEVEKRLKGERFLSSDKEYNYLLSFIDSLQEEPVSEDLEEAAWLYYDKNRLPIPPEWNLNKEFIGFFKAGAEWQITKLMADATEAVVAIDSGGYPYIDKTIELYDYDKDVPLAKKGDKYKVILIKEG